ncbi:arginine--tRNA ligase [Candidatus Nomurabacteria bacterium]|nr:arginine--tRNA ligase [Candidatus Nomurabacteria bacterium]
MELEIQKIVQDLFGVHTKVLLTRPDPIFGDYSTNVALQLSKDLLERPQNLAKRIVDRLRTHKDIREVVVAGPGFINIFLTNEALLSATLRKPAKQLIGKNIVLEYSCPNAFKELHTGHLYQTVFGDILARLMTVGGATVHRTSFGGDVGLHVAKCLWGICSWLGGVNPSELARIDGDVFSRANWISRCYVSGAKSYEENGSVKDEIDKLNKIIYEFHSKNNHESPLAVIYWTTRQWSLDYFDAFYDMIKVDRMRYYPESSTVGVGISVVNEQLARGNLRESDGAIVFRGDNNRRLHTRVFITSRGLPTYETKDIGVIWQEKSDYDFDHRYVITGNDQKEYMRVVFAAAEVFRPELLGAMTHLTNGTVRFGDGRKMSSRLGNVNRAVDAISIVRDKVRELVEDESLIEEVTLGAIKYTFAKYRLGGDIAFDVNETVSLAGNSGPYLQYAHARARRILEKVALHTIAPDDVQEEDRSLLRKLGEYSEVIDLAIRQLEPHHICTYLFELAQEFNRYYEKNKVVGSDREQHRASIVALYADTLKTGLGILGIHAPYRM